MNKILMPLFLIGLLGCSKPSKTKSEMETILDEFEWQLQKDLNDDDLNGSLSMAVIKGDKIIRTKAFGIADLENSKADTNSIYRIGSVSKSFTAFLMMRLVQKGVFALDDPVEKYLPEVKRIVGYSKHTTFTFRQLASHTSGLGHLPKTRFVPCQVAAWDSLLLTVLPKTHFRYQPNERYAYSNIGFGILGLAISRAAQRPFTTLMQTEVFEPLQMNHTFYVIPENEMQHWAKGRSGGPIGGYDDDRPRRELPGRSWGVPNGGIWSTANDLARFMIGNAGYSDLLNQQHLEMMQTTQTPKGNWQENYGLGFSIYQDSTLHTIGHQGGTPGYRADLLLEKNSKYGVILLRNYNWGITNLYLRSTLLLKRLNQLNKND
ncbi:MAG: serine hydrolase domain-containing protein [Cytophagales bacterium]|nr:serine hydrolase domain-containing protein [Cytophagales bacterium]